MLGLAVSGWNGELAGELGKGMRVEEGRSAPFESFVLTLRFFISTRLASLLSRPSCFDKENFPNRKKKESKAQRSSALKSFLALLFTSTAQLLISSTHLHRQKEQEAVRLNAFERAFSILFDVQKKCRCRPSSTFLAFPNQLAELALLSLFGPLFDKIFRSCVMLVKVILHPCSLSGVKRTADFGDRDGKMRAFFFFFFISHRRHNIRRR